MYAFRDIGHGLVGAVSGVVMNPIRGAQRRGVAGFGVGVLSGLIGVVTKVREILCRFLSLPPPPLFFFFFFLLSFFFVLLQPIVGVLDATSQISHGIQNSSVSGRFRVRRPRQFNDLAGTLQPFDGHLADAQELLQVVLRKKNIYFLLFFFSSKKKSDFG